MYVIKNGHGNYFRINLEKKKISWTSDFNKATKYDIPICELAYKLVDNLEKIHNIKGCQIVEIKS